jgi:broad specificity phosphatase PhoE
LFRQAFDANATETTASIPTAFGTRALYRIWTGVPMSTLLLVRHGQARAFEADSDRLTEAGEEQARRVGEHLAVSGVEFDEAYAGTLVRQRRTLEIAADAYARAGKNFPSPTFDAAWNEYDAGGILGGLMPALRGTDPAFAKLVDEFEQGVARPDRNRYFQRMFEVLMAAWQQGSVTAEAVEPFAAFHHRARSAFEAITARGGRRTVVVFTSGGPIGVCVQTVLEAVPMTALRLNWRVKNASLTEFVFSEGRVSLEYFNTVDYLPKELRTFR